MAQNTHVLLPDETFTRADYTALRAYCLKLPIERIASLYYGEDSPQVEEGLERFLIRMRDLLVERAIENQPAFATALTHARKTGNISAKALDILIQAADLKAPVPSREDAIGKWLRPRTVRSLRGDGIDTLGAFADFVNERGEAWWRGIPRLGAKRAVILMTWLRQHKTLGDINPAPRRVAQMPAYELLDPERTSTLKPLGTFCLPVNLDGQFGVNRSSTFCFITAMDDLAAIDCYLARFEHQPHTLRAYRKELERLVLWSVHVAKKPVSSLLVDDCESYKRFIQAPNRAFCGRTAQRGSALWRPFAEKPMTASSQRYAVQVLRAAFNYLVKVRYLAGNPWEAVRDPQVIQLINPIKVERALPPESWETLVETLRRRGEVQDNRQDRIALAALLLMGDSGLRRSEVVRVLRADLRPSEHVHGVWMMTTLGKRNKQRLVPVSPRTIVALRKHWADHGLDLYDPAEQERPLLVPLTVPPTGAALARHQHREDTAVQGYSVNAVYALVKTALSRVKEELLALSAEMPDEMTVEQIETMAAASPHAFRHTFGTVAVEQGMSQAVVQDVMGHADSSTTKLYSKSRAKHIAEEAARFYAQDNK
ncbi:phage integrase family protein [Pseudoduganella lutea]|nr:phage integrase family protein [Pseudoduganella lutea]